MIISSARGGDLLARNAKLVDATGSLPPDEMSVLIRGGEIVEIGTALNADGIPTLDAAGMTVLPGLIDAHVHFTAAPGTARREDSQEAIRMLNHQHLRSYLACGVTTVLDLGIEPKVATDIQEWLGAGNPGPRFLHLGPMITTPGGYPGNDRWGPVATVDDVERILELAQSLGAVGVKVPVERGYGPFASWNNHSPEIRQAIVRGAGERNLPIYVHATSSKDQKSALEMNPHVLAHPIFAGPWVGQFVRPDRASRKFVDLVAARGAYQMSSLAVIDMWPAVFDPSRLDDSLIRLTVPELELSTALDPGTLSFARETLLEDFGPSWFSASLKRFVARQLWNKRTIRDGLRRSQKALRRLHEAGVPIVVGSDVPSPWPIAFFIFHGTTTLREMELLGDAGLSPQEVLAAATRVPAEMLDLAHQIGTIEVGKCADLVIVDGDPRKDLRNLRNVRWTIREGVARTPAEWMTA